MLKFLVSTQLDYNFALIHPIGSTRCTCLNILSPTLVGLYFFFY